MNHDGDDDGGNGNFNHDDSGDNHEYGHEARRKRN